MRSKVNRRRGCNRGGRCDLRGSLTPKRSTATAASDAGVVDQVGQTAAKSELREFEHARWCGTIPSEQPIEGVEIVLESDPDQTGEK